LFNDFPAVQPVTVCPGKAHLRTDGWSTQQFPTMRAGHHAACHDAVAFGDDVFDALIQVGQAGSHHLDDGAVCVSASHISYRQMRDISFGNNIVEIVVASMVSNVSKPLDDGLVSFN
jgi:hypothetical protein